MADVQFNFRIVRDDGAPITGREVIGVLRFFLDRKREPRGYSIEAINWRAARRTRDGGQHWPGWTTPDTTDKAREAMLEHFWYIVYHIGIDKLRLGGVKAPRL